VGFDYLYNDSVFKFPPVYLNVTYYNTEDGVELLDIQEDFHDWKKSTSKINKKSNLWWIWIILSVICVISVLFLLWRRTHNKRHALKQSLQEITLEQIEKLKKEKLWQKDMLKEHFVQFSHILRTYLTNRFGISFLDKTTEQSILLLDQLELDEKIKNMILQLLKKSDLVKFADSRTEETYIQVLFEELTLIVHQTTPILEDS
jgi:flagellar biosynthesis/type III secretory pathway M-ring protein FliF/YscJ